MQSLGRLTQLPPSPETSSLEVLSDVIPPSFTLGVGAATRMEDVPPRLRSAANYGPFHPQAIACSPPTFSTSTASSSQNASIPQDSSSIGAVAGVDGISLFRTSRPDAPLLVLSHSATTTTTTAAAVAASRQGVANTGINGINSDGIQSLAFQPKLTNSILLAASRGNGLLIWDASGHSLSPLMGRLAVETDSSSMDDIRSIAWKSNTDSIAVSTSTYTCLWDLRTSLGSKTSKPSVRFGTNTNRSVLRQVACSNQEQCATMDNSGLVRVYDLRMTGNSSSKPKVLTNFVTCRFAGIGLASFQMSTKENYWMTWGLDSPKSDAVVKLWSTSVPATATTLSTTTTKEDLETDSDTYWHMDGSDERTALPVNLMEQSLATQVAQFTMPYLACARVCPAPFEDSIVTVGATSSKLGSGWKAEMWKVVLDHDDEEETSQTTDTFGVEKILSFVGDNQLMNNCTDTTTIGPLRGAELALCQAPASLSNGDNNSERNNKSDWELLLCCMSEDGFVTTTFVEAAPPLDGGSGAALPPARSQTPLRFFPDERRGTATVDAASALKAITDDSNGHGRHPLDDTRHAYGHPQQQQLQQQQQTPLHQHDGPAGFHWKAGTDKASTDYPTDIKPSRSDGGGASMPFDMDVGLAPPIEAPAVALTVDSEKDMDPSKTRRGKSKRTVSDRVPCPRLCGATFSSGAGGLICFNNGEIHKMWAWYQKNESRRKSSGRLRSVSDADMEALKYPRLKKDLDDMTVAAKDAQWGETHDDEQDHETQDSEESGDLFEDLSSDEEDDVDGVPKQDEEAADRSGDIFEGYEKSIGLPPTSSSNATSGDVLQQIRPPIDLIQAQERQRQAFLFDGPSSDVLAPIVQLNYDTNATMFNGQNVGLAEHLILGDWSVLPQPEKSDTSVSESSTVENSVGGDTDETSYPSSHRASPYGRLGSSGSSLTPQAHGNSNMSKPLSDPRLTMRDGAAFPNRQTALLARDDAPVHGGEYAVRPKRDESMVILRKLLPTPYQSLLSPPDSHLLPNTLDKTTANIKRSISSNAVMQTVRESMAVANLGRSLSSERSIEVSQLRFGVYKAAPREETTIEFQRREILKLICMHNASVCLDFGQDEKANTWSILAETTDNINPDGDGCDGWGGPALGRELVKNILSYYEAQGDIQMVSSIVCVLSSGHREDSTLLPTEENAKYDLYIQLYAELVYCWGLLTKRVELHKHLSRHLPLLDGAHSTFRHSGDNKLTSNDHNSKEGRLPGISVAMTCPRCNSSNVTANNVCSECHDFAFRCIMCDNAVRGLFTLCSLCGHGGHLDHIREWFDEQGHTKCPTGCGCTCVMPLSSLSSPASTAVTAPTQSVPPPASPTIPSQEPEFLVLQQQQQRMSFVAF